MAQLRRASGESGKVRRRCRLHGQHIPLVRFFPSFIFGLLWFVGGEEGECFRFCGWLGEVQSVLDGRSDVWLSVAEVALRHPTQNHQIQYKAREARSRQ